MFPNNNKTKQNIDRLLMEMQNLKPYEKIEVRLKDNKAGTIVWQKTIISRYEIDI